MSRVEAAAGFPDDIEQCKVELLLFDELQGLLCRLAGTHHHVALTADSSRDAFARDGMIVHDR